MGSRKHISRKDISASAFTPKPSPDILQTRGFSNGVKARSNELPTISDVLQTRPFSTPSQKSSPSKAQPLTPESLEKAEAFGYKAASIPLFAPEPAAPIQAKLTIGEPGDKYEEEADTVAAQVVDKINTPQPQQTPVGETVQPEEMEDLEVKEKPEVENIQREDMLDEGEDEKISPQLESDTLQRDEMPQEEEAKIGSVQRAPMDIVNVVIQRANDMSSRPTETDLQAALNHIKQQDFSVPRSRGIGGCHDRNNFMALQSGADVKYQFTLVKEDALSVPGVSKITYKLYKLQRDGSLEIDLSTGAPVPQDKELTKTVYDPGTWSDASLLTAATEAAQDAYDRTQLSREWEGETRDRYKIRGYVTGGNITSFFFA